MSGATSFPKSSNCYCTEIHQIDKIDQIDEKLQIREVKFQEPPNCFDFETVVKKFSKKRDIATLIFGDLRKPFEEFQSRNPNFLMTWSHFIDPEKNQDIFVIHSMPYKKKFLKKGEKDENGKKMM